MVATTDDDDNDYFHITVHGQYAPQVNAGARCPRILEPHLS